MDNYHQQQLTILRAQKKLTREQGTSSAAIKRLIFTQHATNNNLLTVITRF